MPDKAIDNVRRKLKDLLANVYVDVYDYELDQIIADNYDLIKNWDEEKFDDLINYLMEGIK